MMYPKRKGVTLIIGKPPPGYQEEEKSEDACPHAIELALRDAWEAMKKDKRDDWIAAMKDAISAGYGE
jgi:hypothetical protein